MVPADQRYAEALGGLPRKPGDDDSRSAMQRYSQFVSEVTAGTFAGILRERGMNGTLPAANAAGSTGSERRMSGGIGAKKVDVTWSTEESGLLFAISIKSINFRDRRSGNFQKNLTNRRGDMLFEAVTLHRRFPYAVLGGVLLLDEGAARDDTDRRDSTFANAHARFRLFTGRTDPAGRDEQFEELFILLLNGDDASFQAFAVGRPDHPISLEDVFERFVRRVVERNPDFYELRHGVIERI